MSTKRVVLAICAVAVMLPFGVSGADAATVVAPEAGVASAAATGFDRAIDLYVAQEVAAGRLSAAEASLAREQLQLIFGSLTRAEQARLLASSGGLDSQERVQGAIAALKSAAVSEARSALADVQAAQGGDSNARAQGLVPKLGGDADKVFLATAGPCRIYDTRNGPGQLPALTARQVWALSILNGYNFAVDQGGTGVTGAGNCVPMAFPGTRPVSVVAIVTVINTLTAGALQAWNGGTTLIVGGAVLAWNPGDRGSNTTVIPMDRAIVAYPGSGAKRDFGIYNNSGAPVDVIIDVVGYFIDNQATPLDCVTISGPGFSLAAVDSVLFAAPSCPAGYTAIVAQPVTNVYGVDAGTLFEDFCRISNYTGTAKGVNCNARCCRIPGR